MGPRARPGKYAGVAQEQAVELRPLKEQVDADDDDGVPQQLQWRLKTCEGGLCLGDQTLVPEGPLYFNALCTTISGDEQDGDICGGGDVTVELGDGRLTVKEDVGVDVGLFQVRV